MAMELDQIVPFGRTGAEYECMFNLTAEDMQQRILDCGAGPASFNAEWTAEGGSIISIDPIYRFTAGQIRQRFEAVVDDIIAQVDATPNDWVWSYHRDSQDLRRNRSQALARFLADYEAGRRDRRYCAGELPQLPLADQSADLALCSHLLFLYSDHLDLEFHRQAVQELCRVAREVRIFPLLTLDLRYSPYVEPIQAQLVADGWQTHIETVSYEFQRGGNQMLRIVQQA